MANLKFSKNSDISNALYKNFPNQKWCCTILYISLIKFVYGLPETNCLNMRTRWPQPKIMRPKCPTQTFPLATVVCSQRQINYKRGLSVGVLIHYENLLLYHFNNNNNSFFSSLWNTKMSEKGTDDRINSDSFLRLSISGYILQSDRIVK